MLIILIVAVAFFLLTITVLIKKRDKLTIAKKPIAYNFLVSDAKNFRDTLKYNIILYKQRLSPLGDKMLKGDIDIDWGKGVIIKGTFALYSELYLLTARLSTFSDIHRSVDKECLNLEVGSDFKERMFEYIKYRENILGKDAWDIRKTPPTNIKERLYLKVKITSRIVDRIKCNQAKIDVINEYLKRIEEMDACQFKFSDAQVELNAIIHGENI